MLETINKIQDSKFHLSLAREQTVQLLPTIQLPEREDKVFRRHIFTNTKPSDLVKREINNIYAKQLVVEQKQADPQVVWLQQEIERERERTKHEKFPWWSDLGGWFNHEQ